MSCSTRVVVLADEDRVLLDGHLRRREGRPMDRDPSRDVVGAAQRAQDVAVRARAADRARDSSAWRYWVRTVSVGVQPRSRRARPARASRRPPMSRARSRLSLRRRLGAVPTSPRPPCPTRRRRDGPPATRGSRPERRPPRPASGHRRRTSRGSAGGLIQPQPTTSPPSSQIRIRVGQSASGPPPRVHHSRSPGVHETCGRRGLAQAADTMARHGPEIVGRRSRRGT